ncbi:MAG: hypothetical protein NC131_09160, partial [Roseburia sp.]|nr:hypothetical protein [Roseburia sp.]
MTAFFVFDPLNFFRPDFPEATFSPHTYENFALPNPQRSLSVSQYLPGPAGAAGEHEKSRRGRLEALGGGGLEVVGGGLVAGWLVLGG